MKTKQQKTPYTDEERTKMAHQAGQLLQAKLPANGDVAFVLVVATRTAEGKSRFAQVSNLPPRDLARLCTRVAYASSPEGMVDVLESLDQMIPSPPPVPSGEDN